DGTLPQPLEYLVRDVARRHGTIRVRELGCCLRVSDPAVLDEIMATSSLAPLGLSRLAPTVLGSAGSVAETLQALRAAGHAPIEEDAQAAPIAEHAGEHRAEAGRRRQPSGAELLPGGSELPGGAVPGPARSDQQSQPSGDLTAVASELLAAGAGTVRELSGKAPEGLEAAAKLTTREQRLLGDAIDKGAPVRISYTNARGADTIRVIEEAVLEGPLLHAWCTLRQDDRVFALARISSVSPA
ncbi:MAG: helicase-associated domain-containing protein, partial [Micromonosporaceae bacterium]